MNLIHSSKLRGNWEGEKYEFFKIEVHIQMRSTNTTRKEWALRKLEEIKTLEENSMDKDKTALMKDAENKVGQIYGCYESEIKDTYDNYEYPFTHFCFIETVEDYPDLDFQSTGGKDPLWPFCDIDSYSALIETTWDKIEKAKEKINDYKNYKYC